MATQTSAPDRTVPTRRISFEEALEGLPRHFAGDGDLVWSHVIAALSSVFPDGEDFFVRSVRHYRNQITDADLKRQVNGFIGQEAMHGREHRVFNDKLAELGYPTPRVAGMAKRSLEFREKVAPPISNLAATAALEHFTAVMAEVVLTSEDMPSIGGHPAVRDLFLWHALEEAEHKAVAFDVYRAMGGSERMRIWTMKGVRLAFIVGIGFQVILSLLADKQTYKKGVFRKSWKAFRSSPLVSKGVWKKLKEYDRRGFHPDQIDTDGLVTQWREDLFGAEGSLNELLTSPVAA